MRKLLFSFFLLIPLICVGQNNYYVAVNGNDNNPGTIDEPFATWNRGFSILSPGDTLFIRGGVYNSIGTVSLNPENHSSPVGSSGTAEQPITIMGYPGEWPILDCINHCEIYSDRTWNVYNSAISLNRVEYVYFKDFEVRNIQQCDPVLTGAISASECCNLTFDHIVVHDVGQRGFWMTSGAWNEFDGEDPSVPVAPGPWGFNHPDTTRYINCDVYNLFDSQSSSPGNGADGWKTVNYSGNFVEWRGCRIWNYTDDAIDPTGLGSIRHINNCWAMPGTKYDNANGGSWSFEKNGFKCAAPLNEYQYDTSTNYLKISNSLAIGCAHGFHELDAISSDPTRTGYLRNNSIYYNNTAFRCGIGFTSGISNDSYYPRLSTYKNNISFQSTTNEPGVGVPYDVNLRGISYTESNNSWVYTSSYPNFTDNSQIELTNEDFESVDLSEIYALFTAPRKSDGSLPSSPIRLRENSDLIDAGSDVGLAYYGDMPDIGHFEYMPVNYSPLEITEFSPEQTQSTVSITYYSPRTESISVIISDDSGNQVHGFNTNATEGTNNTVSVDLSEFESGIYTIRLNNGESTASCTVTKESTDIIIQPQIVSIFPNPTVDFIVIQFKWQADTNLTMYVSNEINNIVLEDVIQAVKGTNKKVLNLSSLPKGNYQIVLSDGIESLITTISKL